MRSQALDKAYRRIAWLRLAGLAACVILIGRAGHLTVANKRADDLYKQQIQGEQRLPPSRGTIVDREGRELALTVRSTSVYAIPRLMKDRVATARTVARTLGLDPTRFGHVAKGEDRRDLVEPNRITLLSFERLWFE